MAIMLITHDLGVVAEIADDVVVMYLGGSRAGRVDAIFHDPKHPYTPRVPALDPPMLGRTRERLASITGGAAPLRPAKGCPYHTRCRIHAGRWDRHVPGCSVGQRHAVSCFLYE